MSSQSFRLETPTLGMLKIDTAGHTMPVTLPRNSIVTPDDNPLEGNRLIDVVWQGTTIMMFTQDLRERAVVIQEPGCSGR